MVAAVFAQTGWKPLEISIVTLLARTMSQTAFRIQLALTIMTRVFGSYCQLTKAGFHVMLKPPNIFTMIQFNKFSRCVAVSLLPILAKQQVV